MPVGGELPGAHFKIIRSGRRLQLIIPLRRYVMSFVQIESFLKRRVSRGARAARQWVRAALCCIVVGMPLSALAADSPSPAEFRSAPQITTPLKELVSEALQNNPEIH